MKAALLVFAVLVPATKLAQAAPAYGWRDGCPTGIRQTQSDGDHVAAGSPLGPTATGIDARQTGAVADLASPLVPSRIVVAPQFLHFASAMDSDGEQGNRARIYGGEVHVQGNIPIVSWDLAASLTSAYLAVAGGDVDRNGDATPAPSQWSNVVLSLSIQNHWTSAQEVPDQVRPDADRPAVIAGRRHAFAFQFLTTASDGVSDKAVSMTFLQRTAFDGALFAPRRVYGFAFETRSEGVGCYAPFLHLRLSGLVGRDVDGQTYGLLPQTLAAGMTVTPGLAVMIQYGLLFSSTTGAISQSLLGSNLIQRFRLGAEYTWRQWSAGVHLDAFLGSSLYEGTAYEVYAALPFGSRD